MAFLDANVLVPVALADTILRSAERGFFLPRWSPTVIGEVARVVHRIHPEIPDTRIQTRLSGMDARFPDASVHGYESLLQTVELPDADDRHVLAAARLSGADVIVTRNLRDFPDDVLRQWGLEAVSPDQFMRDMLDLFPRPMLDIIREQAAHARRPPLSVNDVLASLERAGVPGFVNDVREWIGD
ncbi:MAG: PIN domain-containing protein [Propionibacteriaceae bacterium]|nr:PIN domain-containing protein [Propionibacteriaceae bacterium]